MEVTMLAIKDFDELDGYTYKVCEISSCENEANEIYESDDRIIDVCMQHDKVLNENRWTLW
jgi:hypothetical protein